GMEILIKNVREEKKESWSEPQDRRNSEIKERSPSKDQKPKEELKEESKPREKEKEKTKENDSDRHKDLERDKYREEREKKSRAKQERERDKDRGNKDRDREADREKERERKSEGGREKERLKERDKERERDKGRERDKSTGPGEASKKSSDGSFKDSKAEIETEMSARAARSLTTKVSKRQPRSSVEGRKEDNISAKILDSIVSGLNNEPDQETTASEIGTREANTRSASISDDNSASLWRENAEPEPAAKRQGWTVVFLEGDSGPTGQEKSEVSENSEIPNELSSNLRKIPRPGSARPAPPRVKRQESAEVLAVDRAGSGKAVSNVIADSQNSENEEDDQFVVETAPQLSEMSEIDMVPAVELEEDEKHGGLVKKILETKDYEKLQQSPRAGEKEKLLVYESAWKKEKDIVSKEIEKLRMSIQTLCKSALPLGKMMDYIQEDVDAMQSELQLWHSESRQHAEALHREQSITDCAVEPLKAELAELEQLIRDQQDKICAVKANILKNEEKIQKMVYSINLSSRR
uniref:TRAF3 interacting protein 1 n=1 Tax=Loxodonta africana TaxID=9785 RepID=G3SS94_LOXAF